MRPRTIRLGLLCGALLLAGCASQPEQTTDFEAARAAYLNGDYERALPLMERAALDGNPRAQYTLGYMLYNGLGATLDTTRALQWIRTAAASGEPRAIEALGRLAEGASSP